MSLLELLDEAKGDAVEHGGVAGRDLSEPLGASSPFSLPPVGGRGLQKPPGSDSPFSWP